MTIAKRLRYWCAKSAASFGVIWLVAAGLAACGTVQFETGGRFDPAVLEQSLKTGVSTQVDIIRALGEPYSQGRALMPFHEADRAVWTYYYERGSVDIGSGRANDQRMYLFVFIAGDRFDGYMWFASKLN
jgi:hypothetical protein